MKINLLSKGIIILFLVVFFKGNAQRILVKDSLKNLLSEVVITGITLNKNLSTSTENVQVVSNEELNVAEGLNYTSFLNNVPGVFMQSGALNTNRITIRGIGARSPFGTTAIRAYFGEIPLTDGNGNSAIEDFELGAVSSIEIHKGPSGSSFGVGLGGTIILKPSYGKFESIESSGEVTYGSFGLKRYLLKTSVANSKVATNFVYSNTESNGFRENNNYKRETFTATALVAITSKDSIQFLGNYTNLKAFIPSSINLETLNSRPQSAAPTWKAAQGFEDFQSLLLGVSWQHNFTAKTALHSSVFTTVKQNNEPRPFNILNEKSNAYGFRSRVAGSIANKFNWGAGGELFYDNLKNSTFENRFRDFEPNIGSVVGERLSQLNEIRRYYNVFGEASYTFSEKWLLSLGIVSPKLGLLFDLKKNIQLKASIAHGFSPPTTEETLLPEGEINFNLKPEQGWNFELGSRFSFFRNKLNGNISVYSLQVDDLLVSRRAADESLFAINANYSIYQYKFDTFVDKGVDFSNNELTGVPSGVFNSGIFLQSKVGFYGNLNFQQVGSIPANDANTVFSDSYNLVNVKLGYQNFYKKLKFKAFLGINNIFDVDYVSQLQVNASGFGGNAPRYFYPGNPNYKYETVVADLEIPWGFTWLPDGSMLITEKEGKLYSWTGWLIGYRITSGIQNKWLDLFYSFFN